MRVSGWARLISGSGLTFPGSYRNGINYEPKWATINGEDDL